MVEPGLFLACLLASTGPMSCPGRAAEVADEGERASTSEPETSLPPIVVRAKREFPAYVAPAITVGGKVPLAARDIPNSISVLTEQRIEDQGFTDVDHAMTWVTGVDTRPNDGKQSQYYSRGHALNVAYDGVPAYAALSGYQQFDIAIYDRIEVLRGPSGLLQGSGGPAGTVNMIRKRPTDALAIRGTASYGSWNNRRTTLDVSTPLTENGTVKARFVGTFTDRDAFYDRGQSEKWLGYGLMEYTPTPNWTFTYSSTNQQDDGGPSYGLPVYTDLSGLDVSRSANFMTPWSHSRWRTHEEALSAERRFGDGWTAKVAGIWREQAFIWKDGFAGRVDPTTMTASYGLRNQKHQYYRKAVDAYVSGPFTLFGYEHNLLIGANLDAFSTDGAWSDTVWANGVNIFNSGVLAEPSSLHPNRKENRMTQFGEYGQVRLRVHDRAQLILGGRNTSFDSDNRGTISGAWTAWRQGDKASNEFTPYAGVVVDATNEVTAYASYAESFEPQTSTTYTGEALPPRKGWQAEVGVKSDWLNDQMVGTLSAFVLREINRPMTDPDHPAFSIASGEVESRGLEAEVIGEPVENLKLSAGYTYMTTQYVKDDTMSGATVQSWEPRHSLKIWGVYDVEDGDFKGLSFGGGVLAKSKSYVSSHRLRQNAYAVVDGVIGYKLNDTVSMTLNAYNIFDNRYWSKLLSTTNNFYGEPRSFVLTLAAEF